MALELKKEGLAPVGGEIQMSRPEDRVVIETPEAAEAEVAEMQQETSEEPPAEQAPVAVPIPEARAARAVVGEKDPFLKEIEAVLQEDLKELYASMSPHGQKNFRERGEKIAVTIQEMLPKSKPEKIFPIIKAWLKMIPGTNPFYLEQEAKNKTDKLFLLESSVT